MDDTDRLAHLEARISVLEMLITFEFASQHMQTADPAGAIRRLESLADLVGGLGTDVAGAGQVAMEDLKAAIHRIAELQDRLPRRLVD